MNTTKNINDLEKAILNVNYIPGSTHTGTALQYVRLNSFKPHTGERNNVPNFLVVITDGKSNGRKTISAGSDIQPVEI
jgi:collagen type VI alpha